MCVVKDIIEPSLFMLGNVAEHESMCRQRMQALEAKTPTICSVSWRQGSWRGEAVTVAAVTTSLPPPTARGPDAL